MTYSPGHQGVCELLNSTRSICSETHEWARFEDLHLLTPCLLLQEEGWAGSELFLSELLVQFLLLCPFQGPRLSFFMTLPWAPTLSPSLPLPSCVIGDLDQ